MNFRQTINFIEKLIVKIIIMKFLQKEVSKNRIHTALISKIRKRKKTHKKSGAL